MKAIIDAHLYAFTAHPIWVLALLLWGIWYTDYKRRMALAAPTREGGREHRRRIALGWITVISGLAFMPGMVASHDAQTVMQEATPGAVPADGADPIPRPDHLDADTYYDRNNWYAAELIGNERVEAGAEEKVRGVFEAFRAPINGMAVDPELLAALQPGTHHNEFMELLDLMRDIPYAEHGYKFHDPVIRKFYSQYTWYAPAVDDPKQAEAALTKTQKANVDAIGQFELEHWDEDPDSTALVPVKGEMSAADATLILQWSDLSGNFNGTVAQAMTLDMIQKALAMGADMEAHGKDGITALLAASQSGHPDIVQALLKAGANLEARDSNGTTSLMVASMAGQAATVKLLLKAGANPNASDSMGNTALVGGATGNHGDVVAALLQAGANKDAKNSNGDSPLLFAAGSCAPDAVKVLLQAGADVAEKDKEGVTALQFAEHPFTPGSAENQSRTISELKAAGAQ